MPGFEDFCQVSPCSSNANGPRKLILLACLNRWIWSKSVSLCIPLHWCGMTWWIQFLIF